MQGYRNWTTAHKQITQSASFGIQELIRGRVKQARMGYEDVELLENSRNGSMKSIPKANGKYSSRLSIDQPQQLSSRNG